MGSCGRTGDVSENERRRSTPKIWFGIGQLRVLARGDDAHFKSVRYKLQPETPTLRSSLDTVPYNFADLRESHIQPFAIHPACVLEAASDGGLNRSKTFQLPKELDELLGRCRSAIRVRLEAGIGQVRSEIDLSTFRGC